MNYVSKKLPSRKNRQKRTVKSSALFDLFYEVVSDETHIKEAFSLSRDVVCYLSSRTGREAFMCSARYFAVTSLGAAIVKKYTGCRSGIGYTPLSLRKDNACKKFLSANDRCESFNREFIVKYDEQFNSLRLPDFSAVVYGEVGMSLFKKLGSKDYLTYNNLNSGFRVGPGASAHVDVNVTGMFEKCFEGALSFSSVEAFNVYRWITRVTPLTYLAESVRAKVYGDGDYLDSHAVFLSVPKTGEEERGICKQPSGNMILQLMLHTVLVQVLLEQFDCNLERQQELNRELALLGSFSSFHMETRTWEWCTLDLSSASDYPKCLIDNSFPLLWTQMFNLFRSDKILVGDTLVEKHMMSTMGNGFTFSLMTVFLSAIVQVLYNLADLPEYDHFSSPFNQRGCGDRLKTWGVYGDDIIVDARIYGPLVKVLQDFGFVVNTKKSYSSGLFRESCGGDYYDGYNVRPVYCETLADKHDIFSMINRLNAWSVYHSWPLPRSCEYLLSLLPLEDRTCYVPNWEDDCAGVKVPVSMRSPVYLADLPKPLRKVMDVGDSKSEFYRVYVPRLKRRFVYNERSKKVKWSCIRTRLVYEYDRTVQVDHKVKNLPGSLVCTIAGTITNGTYGVRGFATSYDRVWKTAPSWGNPLENYGEDTRIFPRTVIPLDRFWAESTINNLRRRSFSLELTDELASGYPFAQTSFSCSLYVTPNLIYSVDLFRACYSQSYVDVQKLYSTLFRNDFYSGSSWIRYL